MVLLVSVLLLLVGGCRDEAPVYTTPFSAFGAAADVSLVGVDAARADEIRRQIEHDLRFMDTEWRASGTTALERVNALLATGESFVAPPSIVPVVALSQTLAQQSRDLFNPAIGQLLALWGFRGDTTKCGPPPDAEHVRRLVEAAPRMSDIRINGLEMASANPAVRLDLDTIVKGYAIDLAMETIYTQGVRHAMVRIGDDLRAIGDRAGKPWRVAIRRPTGSAVYGIIQISGDESVFTTGDYERNFLYEGKTYHHIIDPRTGYPAEKSRAVTVIHREASRADAAARALFIAGPEHWPEIAAAMRVDQVLLFDKSGVVHMSAAMAARIERLDEDAPIRVRPALVARGSGSG